MDAPKTYTAPHPVYVDGVYVEPNTPFTTTAAKGAAWVEADAPAQEGEAAPKRARGAKAEDS